MDKDIDLEFVPMKYMGHEGYKAIYLTKEEANGKGEEVMLPVFNLKRVLEKEGLDEGI